MLRKARERWCAVHRDHHESIPSLAFPLTFQLLLEKLRYNKSYGTRRVASGPDIDDDGQVVEVPVASTGTAASVGALLLGARVLGQGCWGQK